VIESSAIIDVTFQPHEHVDVHQLFISIKKKEKERCFVPNETRKRVWKPGNKYNKTLVKKKQFVALYKSRTAAVMSFVAVIAQPKCKHQKTDARYP